MSEIFISYSRENIKQIMPIVNNLIELRVDVWTDNLLETGGNFLLKIDEEIAKTKVVIVFWTPDAISSNNVMGEAYKVTDDNYKHLNHKYFPVKLVDCELAASLAVMQTYDLTAWNGAKDSQVWLEFIRAIGVKLTRPGLVMAAKVLISRNVDDKIEFIRNYPTEPLAEIFWKELREDFSKEFIKQLKDADEIVKYNISDARDKWDVYVNDVPQEFDSWLESLRGRSASIQRPNPLSVATSIEFSGEKLRAEIDGLKKNLAKKERQISSLADENQELESNLREAKEKCVKLDQELKLSKERINLLDEYLKLSKQKIEESKQKVEELESKTKKYNIGCLMPLIILALMAVIIIDHPEIISNLNRFLTSIKQ